VSLCARTIKFNHTWVLKMNIQIFYCSNCMDTNALRQRLGSNGNSDVKTVSLPCSGKVNLLYLLKAFEKGADGVMLVTCEQNECHFLEGNLRAQKRSQAVDGLLNEIGLGEGRMKVIQKNDAGVEQIIAALEELKNNLAERSLRK
jgi:F420-non-reducing hydrogenase iron-sulfur subunit